MVKTILKCSYEYARNLRLDLSNVEFTEVWAKIIQIGKKFSKLYLQKTPNILTKIPTYTGFSWSEFSPDCIDIYLTDFWGPSRTNPVTIKIKDDLEKMLVILTHEIIHINMPRRAIPVDELIYEDIVNQITTKIATDLKLKCSLEEIILYRKKISESDCTVFDIPLHLKTVKEYFKTLNKR